MGFWTPDSKKAIHHRDFTSHIKDMRGLNEGDKKYLAGQFDRFEGQQITHSNFREQVRNMKTDPTLSHEKIRLLEREMMPHFDPPTESGEDEGE